MNSILLFISLSYLASASPNQNLLRFYPAQVLRNEIVEFRPATGLHFSAEAPQNCGSGGLQERGPRSIKCQFVAAGRTAATLNVCDDLLTFCKPTEVQITVSDQVGRDNVVLTKNQVLT